MNLLCARQPVVVVWPAFAPSRLPATRIRRRLSSCDADSTVMQSSLSRLPVQIYCFNILVSIVSAQPNSNCYLARILICVVLRSFAYLGSFSVNIRVCKRICMNHYHKSLHGKLPDYCMYSVFHSTSNLRIKNISSPLYIYNMKYSLMCCFCLVVCCTIVHSVPRYVICARVYCVSHSSQYRAVPVCGISSHINILIPVLM